MSVILYYKAQTSTVLSLVFSADHHRGRGTGRQRQVLLIADRSRLLLGFLWVSEDTGIINRIGAINAGWEWESVVIWVVVTLGLE